MLLQGFPRLASQLIGIQFPVQQVILYMYNNLLITVLTYTGTAPGTPITITSGETTTYDVIGLTSNTYYRYKIVATDGTYLSPTSNFTNITTSPTTGIENTVIKSIIVENNKISVNTNEGQLVSVFSCIGQKIYGEIFRTRLNEITINSRGIYVIKVGNESRKIIL